MALVVDMLIFAFLLCCLSGGTKGVSWSDPVPAGFWPLNKIHYGKDLSGNGNHMKLSNTVFVNGPPNIAESSSAHFDENQLSTALVAELGELPTSKFTLAAWVKIGNGDSTGPLVVWKGSRQLKIQKSGKKIEFYCNGEPAILIPARGKDTLDLQPGVWYFLLVQYSGTPKSEDGSNYEILLHVDDPGTKVSFISAGNNLVLGQGFQLGTSDQASDGQYVEAFDGDVTCVQVYNTTPDVYVVMDTLKERCQEFDSQNTRVSLVGKSIADPGLCIASSHVTQQIKATWVTSLTCSSYCIELANCNSFNVVTNTDGVNQCEFSYMTKALREYYGLHSGTRDTSNANISGAMETRFNCKVFFVR